MTPPLIALEEHYYSKAVYDEIDEPVKQTLEAVPGLSDKLREIGPLRLKDMDHGGISLQVVSHSFTPGGPTAAACRAGNDELAAAIAASGHPARFVALAVLPVSDAAASAHELRRAVTSLSFAGALIDNHAAGRHFDAPAYDALWAVATALDVPIYLHPTWPSPSMAAHYAGAIPPSVAASLAAPGYGWHGDVGLHVLKLFAAGVFDRFPSLKLVLGHFGETLPFLLERAADMSTRWTGWGARARPLRQVYDENVWVTTSGAWGLGPLRCLLEVTRVERVLFAVDYPYESSEAARAWLERVEAAGVLDAGQLRMVAHGNAERLLRVRLPV